MTQPKILKIEKMAGIRCRFLVYYRRNGRPYLDGVWSPTEDQARTDFLAMARELGWEVEVERVEVRR